MKYYCCVKGCKNSIKTKKNNAGSIITFHSFPRSPHLRGKWLDAIGRPDWDVPSHAMVCSEHFAYSKLEYGASGTSVEDDAVPHHNIPLISKYDATDVEVCCICLASDVKMYSSQRGSLKIKIEQVMSFSDKLETEGLPCFVCYMCVMEVHKCCQFIDKCVTAQATLLDVLHKHGKITKKILKNVNRTHLNLSKPLSIFKQSNIKEYTYENDNIDNLTIFDSKLKDETEFKIETNDIKMESDEEVKRPVIDDNNYSDKEMIYGDSDNESVDSFCSDDKTLSMLKKAVNKINKEEKLKHKTVKRKRKTDKRVTKNKEYLTEREIKMKEHFNIVKLSLQEQIDDWNSKFTKPPLSGDAIYHCEICPKQFTHLKTFQTHQRSHDQSRGKVECSVCKVRFKSEATADRHRRHTHEKKFHCKICSNVFSNVQTALRHHLRHSGIKRSDKQTAQKESNEYSCTQCGISFNNKEKLKLHTLDTHGETEPKCDESYHCETCDINFSTQDALTLHTQTSSRHKSKLKSDKTLDLDDSKTCFSCGKEFSTESELTLHVKTEHKRKSYVNRRAETYPTTCEHCGKSVNSRREYWWHTIKEHPAERDSYQRVITAICDTCGKGFQNKTLLRLHELRHSSPSVRCDDCGRAFYDKYALARHTHTHTRARPFVCAHCGQAFTIRTNLNRHAKVHSNVANYECSMCGKKFKYTTSRNLHIRTVHYKQPPPPRKKKTKEAPEPEFKLQ